MAPALKKGVQMSGTALLWCFTWADLPLFSAWGHIDTNPTHTQTASHRTYPSEGFCQSPLTAVSLPAFLSRLGKELAKEGFLSPLSRLSAENQKINIQPDVETQKIPNSLFFQDYQGNLLKCYQAPWDWPRSNTALWVQWVSAWPTPSGALPIAVTTSTGIAVTTRYPTQTILTELCSKSKPCSKICLLFPYSQHPSYHWTDRAAFLLGHILLECPRFGWESYFVSFFFC